MDKCMYPENKNYKYSCVRLIMVKSMNGFNLLDGCEFIKGKFVHFERDVYLDKTHLEKGRYFAFAEIDWHEATPFDKRDFSFNCYGIGQVTIK